MQVTVFILERSCIQDICLNTFKNGEKCTSVKSDAEPNLLLSLKLASPLTSLRIEYATSGELSKSSVSPSESEPVSCCGRWLSWNPSRVLTNLTEALTRSFFDFEERSQTISQGGPC